MGDMYNRGGGALTTTTITSTSVTSDDLEIDDGTMSIDATNNRVGVGTTAPAQVLDVIGTGSFALAEASLSQGNVQVGVDSGGDPGGELMYHTDDYVGLRCADSGALPFAVKPSGNVGIGTVTPGVQLDVTDDTTSSATQGGNLRLTANDGAAMGSGHRLGVVEFAGAEDASNTITVGARIESLTDAGWSASENGASMYLA